MKIFSQLFNKISNIPAQKAFLIFAFLFGTLFLFVTPPFEVPDEPAHFHRAYQVSELNFIGQKKDFLAGGQIPKDFLNMVSELMDNIPTKKENKFSLNKLNPYLIKKTDFKNTEFTDFRNTVIYSPTAYIPQSIGIRICKIFDTSLLITFYVTRLLNLFTFIFITYAAIKLMPFQKWTITLLALMPMTLTQAASLSADSTLFALSFLLIAHILKYAFINTGKITKKQIFKMAILAVLISLYKIVYVLIPFLFFLIPKERFQSTKQYITAIFLITVIPIICVAVWSYAVKDLYMPLLSYALPFNQLNTVIKNPQNFLTGFINSFNGLPFLHSFVGNLGWFDNPLPKSFAITYLGILMFSATTDSSGLTLKFPQRIITFAIMFLSVFLLEFIIYLHWNKVSATVIKGLQGRYFIPIAPIFTILFQNRFNSKLKPSDNNKTAFYVCFLIFSLFLTTYFIINRYYQI